MLQEPEGKIYHGEARRNTAKHGQTFRGYRFESEKDRRLEDEKVRRLESEKGEVGGRRSEAGRRR